MSSLLSVSFRSLIFTLFSILLQYSLDLLLQLVSRFQRLHVTVSTNVLATNEHIWHSSLASQFEKSILKLTTISKLVQFYNVGLLGNRTNGLLCFVAVRTVGLKLVIELKVKFS